MPNRILREGINSSQRVNALSPGAELLYRRLMSVVDDYGRYHGSPLTVRTGCWPTCPEKINHSEVVEWLKECCSGPKPLLIIYTVDGAKYLQITDFKQQTRTKSKFPDPESGLLADCEQNACTSRSRISESESYASAGAATQQPSKLQARTEWPLATAALIPHEPAVTPMFVIGLADATAQALISAGDEEPFDDEDLATAIKESYASYTGKGKHGVGLLKLRVPQIIMNWGKNGTQKQA